MNLLTKDAPIFPGLTHLSDQPVFFRDRRNGRCEAFTVHHYRDDKTGELVLITEDRYEDILNGIITAEAFK